MYLFAKNAIFEHIFRFSFFFKVERDVHPSSTKHRKLFESFDMFRRI